MLLPKFFSQQYFSKLITTTAFLRWLLQWHFQNDIHSSISKTSFNVIGFVYFRRLADLSCTTCFDDMMFIFKGGSIFDVLCFLVRSYFIILFSINRNDVAFNVLYIFIFYLQHYDFRSCYSESVVWNSDPCC